MKNYKSNSIDIDFGFTNKGLQKSLHSQMYYGGDYSDFVKAILSADGLLNNSVLIETHTDKAVDRC